jgi:GDP/GTP exchange factor required for growth at low temperature
MTKEGTFADVETTNWNAVKLLATQYGIRLPPLKEIKASAPTCSRPGEGVEVEDLGVGTPFKITAQAIDGGKIVYRFKSRVKEGDVEVQDEELEGSTSETGYDPEPDSPPSSWSKKAGQRKHPSTRTLRTKRSIPILQMMSGVAQDKINGSTSSSPRDKMKATFTRGTASPRQPAPRIQRGDVLGAILGLRDGITAQDYAWIDSRRYEKYAEKAKNSKGKGKAQSSDSVQKPSFARPLHRGQDWRTITTFGEPVLQHRRALSKRGELKTPLLTLTNIGQPQADDDVDDVFHDASLPIEDGVESDEADEFHDQEDDHDEMVIFDVLQHYTIRGKDEEGFQSTPSPVAASLSRTRQSSVSSESLHSPTTAGDVFNDASSVQAMPGDDPRFALWAIRSKDEDDTLVLSSRNGVIDYVPSSPSHFVDAPVNSSIPGTPTSSKRFSFRTPGSANSSIDASPSIGQLSSSQSQKSFTLTSHNQPAILLAASTSCLVAELTSRIDTQLLTDFFYTYRAYLTSEELLRLLILRLRWAMATPNGAKDEARRKIVRVRTYVVIKYWLSNFFEIDFVPNRALRTQLTDWLNAPTSSEAAGIIKSLKKIVRGLKKSYEQSGVGGILLSDATQQGLEGAARHQENNEAKVGDGFKLTLDWNDPIYHDDSSSAKSLSGTDSSRSAPLSGHHAPPPLPLSQNTISRAFVTTVGKLSRFKRNLNARSTAAPHGSGQSKDHYGETGSEGTELDGKDGGDLLFIRGGLEIFLNYFNLLPMSAEDKSEDGHTSDSTNAQEQTPSLSASTHRTSSTPASSIDFGSRGMGNGELESLGRSSESDYGETIAKYGLGITSEESERQHGNFTHVGAAKKASVEQLHHFQSEQTLRSVSTAQPVDYAESPESKSSRRMRSHQRQASKSSSRGRGNIVQIDDLDSSSDEDDGMVRRALRRLPGARDLRIANNVHDLETAPRASLDDSLSVMSFGRVFSSDDRSVASFYDRRSGAVANGSPRSSFDDTPWPASLAPPITLQKITTVQTEMLDPDEALVGYELVKGFRLDQLDSDDEEPGDVEAALRRLEGFIDQDKQKEKQRKVEAMFLRSRVQRDEDEAREKDEERAKNRQSAPSEVQSERQDQESMLERPFSPAILNDKGKRQTAMPVSKSGSSTSSGAKATAINTIPPTPLSRSYTPHAPVHRSFLLEFRSEVIAKQFCLIESELFKAITWQELVSGQWKSKHFTDQVLDWGSFYQSSVRQRVEASSKEDQHSQVSNVEALIARFNLTCNWVASEIVLTRHIDNRAAVVCKLIRIAWKCYHHCNFATLTQIILGLQSPWVERLSKTWSRVGMLEMRMLRDLKAFINPARNFKHLRTAMHDMIIQGGMMDLITSSGPPKGGYKTSQTQLRLSDGCIPFFGLFLSDLTVNDALPTFIEPSSPNSAIKNDSTTGHRTTLADSTAFIHLPSLPEQVQLTPLVNLYKYRNIAVTVKSILAFQERLHSFEFEADANVYVKTLRIRCLEGEQLTQISHLVEP